MSPMAASSGSGGPPDTAAPGPGAAITKNMFLELLVAQLRNQDPLHPADGMQFMTELAQFEQLEQALNNGADLAAIRQALDQLVAGMTKAT